jgi:uncharacterized membrane protein YhaH (DUF805 family)
MNYYIEVLKKYAVFTGRARRKEYWMFVLYNFLISIGIGIVDSLLGLRIVNSNVNLGVLGSLYSLAVLIPSLAVAVRRLHDTEHSGWWIFISLIPLIGFIVLLVFLVTDGQPGGNKYGPNPKGSSEEKKAEQAA